MNRETTLQNLQKWDMRMLRLAREIASWSKDPSTKVGAVIADDAHVVVGLGYNGFARGVEDLQEALEDRAVKYPMTIHAELNAILNATRSVHGCTMYVWPIPVCPVCAGPAIQAGIRRIVYAAKPGEAPQGSAYQIEHPMMHRQLREAGVSLCYAGVLE